MTSITEHQDSTYIRMILEGDSGAGKTGSIASLIAAGYTVNILDLENKLDILVEYLTHPSSEYAKQLKDIDLKNSVDYITITEEMTITPIGRILPRSAKAWDKISKVLGSWPNKGTPSSWGKDTILVIDSLSALSEYALWYILDMNGKIAIDKGFNFLAMMGEAQRLVEKCLTLLCSDNFHCNVIILAHLTPVGEKESGVIANPLDDKMQIDPTVTVKQFPASLGKSLSPRIPRRFSNILLAEHEGPQRRIYTSGLGSVVGKNSAPIRLAPFYPLSTGLASIFKELRRGVEPQKAASAPASSASITQLKVNA